MRGLLTSYEAEPLHKGGFIAAMAQGNFFALFLLCSVGHL
mgnify:FL=1